MNSKDRDELIGYCFAQSITVAVLALCQALIGAYAVLITPMPITTYDITFKNCFCVFGGLFILYWGITTCYDSINDAVKLWKDEKFAIKRYWEKED